MLKSLFLCQRIKANQIQKQLREEKDVLADHVTSLNTHRETQSQMLKKMDERERVLQHAVVGTKHVAVQNQDRFRSKSAQKPVASSFFLNFLHFSFYTHKDRLHKPFTDTFKHVGIFCHFLFILFFVQNSMEKELNLRQQAMELHKRKVWKASLNLGFCCLLV